MSADEGRMREVSPDTLRRLKDASDKYSFSVTALLEGVVTLVEAIFGGGTTTTTPPAGSAHAGAHK